MAEKTHVASHESLQGDLSEAAQDVLTDHKTLKRASDTPYSRIGHLFLNGTQDDLLEILAVVAQEHPSLDCVVQGDPKDHNFKVTSGTATCFIRTLQ